MTCSNATLGRATNSPRAAISQAFPIPESPRQVNAGKCRQPVRCHCASALKLDPLRRFYGDGILGFGLKAAVSPPIMESG